MALKTSPKVRISYPHVFVPQKHRSKPDDAGYYSVAIMIDKNDKEQMEWLKTAYAECKSVLEAQWPDATKRPRIPLIGHEKSPIKDGDKTINAQGFVLGDKNPEYKGHYIIRAASHADNGPIIVVDAGRRELTNKNAIYGGCYCRVNVNPYPRTVAENPGISVGLNGIQKIEDGQSFGMDRPPVEDMFEVESTGANDPANYAVDPFDMGVAGNKPTGTPASDPFGGDDVF